MKNIKVRTKLTIILALVIVLVTSESFISIKNMNQLKTRHLKLWTHHQDRTMMILLKSRLVLSSPCYRKLIMNISLVNILLMKLKK